MAGARRRLRRWLPGLVVLLVALVARGFYLGRLVRAGYLVDTDGVSYLTMADSLLRLRGLTDVFGHPYDHFPPGYPALAGGAGLLLGDLTAGAVAVSFASGLAACVLTYLCLLRVRVRDRRVPRWAPVAVGSLLATHPLAVKLSCRVVADSLLSAMVVGAVLLAILARQRRRSGYFWASLVLAAASYLVKPEGLAFFLILLSWELVCPGPGGWRGRLRPLAGAAVVAGLLVAPYAGWISQQKGRFALTGKSQAWLHGFDADGFDNFVRLNYQLNPAGDRVVVATPGDEGRGAERLTLWAKRYRSNLKRLWRAIRNVLPFGSVWLALAGAVWVASLRPRRWWAAAWGSLLCPMLALPLLFVVPRLLLSMLPVLLAGVAFGLGWLWRRLGRLSPLLPAVLALLAASFLASALREARAVVVPPDFQHTLAWMRHNLGQGDVVTAGKPQLAFHSGGVHLPLPYADPERVARYMCLNGARWMVLGLADVSSRPPLRPVWKEEAAGFQRMFTSATDPRFELRVYRLTEQTASGCR